MHLHVFHKTVHTRDDIRKPTGDRFKRETTINTLRPPFSGLQSKRDFDTFVQDYEADPVSTSDVDDSISKTICIPSAQRSADDNDDEGKFLLCLKCRNIGHTPNSCPREDFLDLPPPPGDPIEYGIGSVWTCSTQRDELRRKWSALGPPPSTTCARCTALDLPGWLQTTPPFQESEELAKMCLHRHGFSRNGAQMHGERDMAPVQDDRVFRTIGTVRDVVFDSRCGLCDCLFDMIPSPSALDQSIVLVRSWTMLRLEHSCLIEDSGMLASSRVVTAVLEPYPVQAEGHRVITIEGDGLVIAGEPSCPSQVPLTSLRLKSDDIDVERVRKWLDICTDKHSFSCTSVRSEKLRCVRLINVETRTIVPYGETFGGYLALSYVWGDVDQSFPGAGIPGTQLPNLPQTLEDALTFTIKLGFRYIWIDSVCINQVDDEDMKVQIGVMSEIYQGALATIVALSAEDANSGLARVASKAGKKSSSVSLQMSCTIGETATTLRTIGPTLEHLLSISPWNTRAWTYQEGRLSPRCIFVSRYGVYFECNSMQCTESLDISCSPLHTRDMHAERDFQSVQTSYTQSLNLVLFRNPVARPIASEDTSLALNIYSLLAMDYSDRQMTHATDGLKAFAGILQALQQAIPVYRTEGFLWGLPCAHLPWAMAWQAHRHGGEEARNPHFPTWTWLSHRGAMYAGGPSMGREGPAPEACPFDLEFAAFNDQRVGDFDFMDATSSRTETVAGRTSIVVFSQKYDDAALEIRKLLVGDPLASHSALESHGDWNDSTAASTKLPLLSPVAKSSMIATSHAGRCLLFRGFAFRISISHRWEELGNGNHSLVEVEIVDDDGEDITLDGITTYDPTSRWGRRKPGTDHLLFLLLTRHIEDDEAVHNLILLEPVPGGRASFCYKRTDMLRLNVPLDKLRVLRKLGLHRLQGTLI